MKLCSSDNHYITAPHYESTLSVCWSFIVLRGFVCVCLCEIKSDYQQKSNMCQTLVNSVCPSSPFLGEWGLMAKGKWGRGGQNLKWGLDNIGGLHQVGGLGPLGQLCSSPEFRLVSSRIKYGNKFSLRATILLNLLVNMSRVFVT